MPIARCTGLIAPGSSSSSPEPENLDAWVADEWSIGGLLRLGGTLTQSTEEGSDLKAIFSDFISSAAGGYYLPETRTFSLVRGFKAEASRPIVYSRTDSPHQLNEYHYHFWTDPPVVMLRDQLVDFLRAANVADLIVTPEIRSSADYVLSAKIKRLEKITGSTPRAVVEMELGLRDNHKDKVVHLNTYRVETTAKSDSVGDAVVALNKALTSAYTLFVEDLKKL